jgi:hypothetical protein
LQLPWLSSWPVTIIVAGVTVIVADGDVIVGVVIGIVNVAALGVIVVDAVVAW